MTSLPKSEIRLRLDALGLSPKGKLALRWRVGGHDDPLVMPHQPSGPDDDELKKRRLARGKQSP